MLTSLTWISVVVLCSWRVCEVSQGGLTCTAWLTFPNCLASLLQPGLLGVFQKLLASKANDHQGFYLLNSIIEHMPPWVTWSSSLWIDQPTLMCTYMPPVTVQCSAAFLTDYRFQAFNSILRASMEAISKREGNRMICIISVVPFVLQFCCGACVHWTACNATMA